MNDTVEIDKAGRLVVPKKVRDALHLTPGTRLSLQKEGEAIVLRPEVEATALYKKKGMWVYHSTGKPLNHDMIQRYMDEEHNESMKRALGEEPVR